MKVLGILKVDVVLEEAVMDEEVVAKVMMKVIMKMIKSILVRRTSLTMDHCGKHDLVRMSADQSNVIVLVRPII